MDPEVQKKAIGDEVPITCRPADMLAPGFEVAKIEVGALARSEEDIISYALFPQIARPFLERRNKGLGGNEEVAAAIAAALFAKMDAKAYKTTSDAGTLRGGNPWKMSARTWSERWW
jgi:oxaloacetate decarboxylase alpha subunit